MQAHTTAACSESGAGRFAASLDLKRPRVLRPALTRLRARVAMGQVMGRKKSQQWYRGPAVRYARATCICSIFCELREEQEALPKQIPGPAYRRNMGRR